MILGKLWSALRAQLNKVANLFWSADPIAQMQYEYDSAVEQLKQGRVGLEQYRVLVERVTRQTVANRNAVANLESKIKAYLASGDRDTAGKFALELQRAKKELEENEAQLKMHEDAYNNNLTKIKHASGKLQQIRDKINKYDSELKMSKAEAELARLAQDKIGLNRARARVAADLSGQGLEDIHREQAMEKVQADQALRDFEVQMGMVTPETAKVPEADKELGPGKARETTRQG